MYAYLSAFGAKRTATAHIDGHGDDRMHGHAAGENEHHPRAP